MPPEQALHCLELLEAKSVQAKCERLKKRIRELELQGNFEEAFRLMDDLERSVARPPSLNSCNMRSRGTQGCLGKHAR